MLKQRRHIKGQLQIIVIPAQAGIQEFSRTGPQAPQGHFLRGACAGVTKYGSVPAFAGVTKYGSAPAFAAMTTLSALAIWLTFVANQIQD